MSVRGAVRMDPATLEVSRQMSRWLVKNADGKGWRKKLTCMQLLKQKQEQMKAEFGTSSQQFQEATKMAQLMEDTPAMAAKAWRQSYRPNKERIRGMDLDEMILIANLNAK